MIIIKEKFNRFKKIFTFFAILFLGSALFFLNHIQAENGLPLEEVELQCTDYDHGQNYYEKNKAELRELNVAEPSVITEYDVCNEDGTLKEWYCEENEEGVSMNGKIFECPNGCQNGACLTINKTNSNDYALLNNLIGKLLLQVEDRGRIWYIDFAGNKHEVTFNNALNLFETLATGITNNDLYQIPVDYDSWTSYLGDRLKGKLLLQVEDRGRIWYVDFEGQRHEATWDNLMELFESLALGITNENLSKIGTYNDYDDDGLTDSEELNFYKTNPYDADSDDDGYSDGEEVVKGYNPLGEGLLSLEFMDTDRDGLTDSEELNFYKTNPYDADSDDDGYSDGEEVGHGYNPLGAYMSIYSSELLSALVYGGDNNDNFNSFYKYGNYIYAVGSTYSEGFGSQDILIVKFNKNDLSIVEKKVYGESGHENLEDLYVEEDYIYAIGSSDVLGQGKKDALLMKLDKDNLNIVDLKVYGGSQNDSFTAIQVDEEYIYVVGQTESVGAGESDTLLVIFDKENLDIINEEIYGGISVDYFNSIYVTDNCIYAGGATQSLGIVNGEVLDEEEYTPEELLVMGIGNKDLLLVKFNKDLEIIERKVLGNAADNFVQAIYGDEEYIYVAGQTKNITREQSDALIGKFDVTDLDDYELKAYGLNSSEDIFQDIYIDQDYIYASGSASSSGTRNLDASIIRLSKTDFNTKKVKIFGSSKNDVFNKIYSDGDYIYTCGQTKIGDFYDSILTKVISLEDGINNTSPENFVWEDSNLDFFDIHLLSTDSDGLELNMASISSSTEEYIVLGSDNFLFEILEEEELTYTVEVVTSTIEYNTFDITIEPPLEELVKNNFKFFKGEEDAQIEILVIFSNFEGSTEELSTYNIGVYLEDNENLEFEEDINYEVQVIEWIEEDEEEEEIIDESLILVSPVLTSGYQDSALTDSYLNIGKYIVSSNNENFCANYACCSDADCNDNNSNTSDACINPYFDNAYCQHELIPSAIECLSSIDCEDGISCTTDICVLGTNACSHQDILENIDDDGCCLSSVWTYEFVPWKLDNDCDRALQINSPLIIGDAEEILNLFSDNPQAIILLQEFIYDENDAINHGTKVLIGKLEADNIYTSYNDYSGEGILILEVINSGSSLEEQILSIDISGVLKNIYLPSIDSSISAEVDYYIADDGATYYSLYKGNGFFMSPLEAFIDQNLAQDSI